MRSGSSLPSPLSLDTLFQHLHFPAERRGVSAAIEQTPFVPNGVIHLLLPGLESHWPQPDRWVALKKAVKSKNKPPITVPEARVLALPSILVRPVGNLLDALTKITGYLPTLIHPEEQVKSSRRPYLLGIKPAKAGYVEPFPYTKDLSKQDLPTLRHAGGVWLFSKPKATRTNSAFSWLTLLPQFSPNYSPLTRLKEGPYVIDTPTSLAERLATHKRFTRKLVEALGFSLEQPIRHVVSTHRYPSSRSLEGECFPPYASIWGSPPLALQHQGVQLDLFEHGPQAVAASHAQVLR